MQMNNVTSICIVAVYDVQCTMYSVQRTVYSAQRTVYYLIKSIIYNIYVKLITTKYILS